MNWTALTLAFAVTIGLAAAWNFDADEKFQIIKTICTRKAVKPGDGIVCSLLFDDQILSSDAGKSNDN